MYSTGHSECIVTENYTNAQKFLDEVDAAAVYVKRQPDLRTEVSSDSVRR